MPSGRAILVGFAARAVFALAALVGLAWGLGTFATTRPISQLDRAGARILAGESFNAQQMDAFGLLADQALAQPVCRATAMQSAAIVRLRLVELAIESSDRTQYAKRFGALEQGVRYALECAPTASFLWFLLYWVEITRNGFDAKYIRLLEASYDLGPREGWIATRRNRIALAIVDQLPPELANKVFREFAGLVSSGLVEEAAANLAGPGWAYRDTLVAQLTEGRISHRRRLYNLLRRRGIDLVIPGVDPVEGRPWS
jgi:hypothetical protein